MKNNVIHSSSHVSESHFLPRETRGEGAARTPVFYNGTKGFEFIYTPDFQQQSHSCILSTLHYILYYAQIKQIELPGKVYQDILLLFYATVLEADKGGTLDKDLSNPISDILSCIEASLSSDKSVVRNKTNVFLKSYPMNYFLEVLVKAGASLDAVQKSFRFFCAMDNFDKLNKSDKLKSANAEQLLNLYMAKKASPESICNLIFSLGMLAASQRLVGTLSKDIVCAALRYFNDSFVSESDLPFLPKIIYGSGILAVTKTCPGLSLLESLDRKVQTLFDETMYGRYLEGIAEGYTYLGADLPKKFAQKRCMEAKPFDPRKLERTRLLEEIFEADSPQSIGAWYFDLFIVSVKLLVRFNDQPIAAWKLTLQRQWLYENGGYTLLVCPIDETFEMTRAKIQDVTDFLLSRRRWEFSSRLGLFEAPSSADEDEAEEEPPVKRARKGGF